MVGAERHFVLLQLSLSMNGVKPGGYSCSSRKAEPASLGRLNPVFLSLSGLHAFCG